MDVCSQGRSLRGGQGGQLPPLGFPVFKNNLLLLLLLHLVPVLAQEALPPSYLGQATALVVAVWMCVLVVWMFVLAV